MRASRFTRRSAITIRRTRSTTENSTWKDAGITPSGATSGGPQGWPGPGVRFFVLDSRGFDPDQLAWLQSELAKSETAWKICYFHHPIYTDGRYASAARVLRLALEPILIKGDVDVVLSGHEHLYERIKPQHGISYFISGGAGSLRKGDITPSPRTARGFDTDYHFMMMEVSGDTLYFQAISRTGETVDAGAIVRGGDSRTVLGLGS